jgi:hypothetical protein
MIVKVLVANVKTATSLVENVETATSLVENVKTVTAHAETAKKEQRVGLIVLVANSLMHRQNFHSAQRLSAFVHCASM